MKVYGKVITAIPSERIIKVRAVDRMYMLYCTKKDFKEFGPYFYKKPYIYLEIKDEKKYIEGYYCYEIIMFYKIVESTARRRNVFYDVNDIKKGIQTVLKNTRNKLFLDLEFSLPSSYQTMPYNPEILQYGLVIENDKGDIILKESSFVKPLKPYAINGRTLKFLSLKREDINSGITYLEFYNLLDKYIKEYDAKIIAWGKNDILMMEKSFKLNKLKPLDIRNRYLNLMQVIKNYYNFKNDLGLFNAYEKLSGLKLESQKHDALEDSEVTREIYHLFEKLVNSSNNMY